jgi:hypothetical protein
VFKKQETNFPISELVETLNFEDSADAIDFLDQCGLNEIITEGKKKFVIFKGQVVDSLLKTRRVKDRENQHREVKIQPEANFMKKGIEDRVEFVPLSSILRGGIDRKLPFRPLLQSTIYPADVQEEQSLDSFMKKEKKISVRDDKFYVDIDDICATDFIVAEDTYMDRYSDVMPSVRVESEEATAARGLSSYISSESLTQEEHADSVIDGNQQTATADKKEKKQKDKKEKKEKKEKKKKLNIQEAIVQEPGNSLVPPLASDQMMRPSAFSFFSGIPKALYQDGMDGQLEEPQAENILNSIQSQSPKRGRSAEEEERKKVRAYDIATDVSEAYRLTTFAKYMIKWVDCMRGPLVKDNFLFVRNKFMAWQRLCKERVVRF